VGVDLFALLRVCDIITFFRATIGLSLRGVAAMRCGACIRATLTQTDG
jgi:hypothetical protein